MVYQAHKVCPYLLQGLVIDRPNQVWAADVTYIPWQRASCTWWQSSTGTQDKVLAWELANSLDARFCVEALETALAHYGRPEIFNTDQGSQFTSEAFTSALTAHDIRISRDVKGRWVDNVFVERPWRSLKYEEVYLKGYATVAEARTANTSSW